MLIKSSGDGSSPQFIDPMATLEGTSSLFEGRNRLGNQALPPGANNREHLQKNWKLLHTLKRATLIARQNAALTPPQVASEVDPDGLEALQQAAQRGELQKQRSGWKQWDTIAPASGYEFLNYADPLSPLKARDEEALMALFQGGNMAEIEADISHCLLQLLPEPCWEEDPLEFLKDFL